MIVKKQRFYCKCIKSSCSIPDGPGAFLTIVILGLKMTILFKMMILENLDNSLTVFEFSG